MLYGLCDFVKPCCVTCDWRCILVYIICIPYFTCMRSCLQKHFTDIMLIFATTLHTTFMKINYKRNSTWFRAFSGKLWDALFIWIHDVTQQWDLQHSTRNVQVLANVQKVVGYRMYLRLFTIQLQGRRPSCGIVNRPWDILYYQETACWLIYVQVAMQWSVRVVLSHSFP